MPTINREDRESKFLRYKKKEREWSLCLGDDGKFRGREGEPKQREEWKQSNKEKKMTKKKKDEWVEGLSTKSEVGTVVSVT